MRVGVVDIGTNSMRLLITDGHAEEGRWAQVTGLGQGVDATGELSEDAMSRTLEALTRYGSLMDTSGVQRRVAIATSASRDAANKDLFFDRAAEALGVRPRLITGEEEGRLAYSGATADFTVAGTVVVSDIGGGSTELVTSRSVRSVEIGTVRLGERHLPVRPPARAQIEEVREALRSLFSDVSVDQVAAHIGVAGTWTSLSAISQGLPVYRPDRVHGSRLGITEIRDLVDRLSVLSLADTREIPGLDPERAPVILPGAMIAVAVMERLGVGETIVSERDTLDGVAMELIGIP